MTDVCPPVAPHAPRLPYHGDIFRSAITGEDGTVDPGYLGLYVIIVLVLGTIPFTLVIATVRMFIEPGHPLDLVGVAAVIGGAGGCFGAAAGGVGVFRMGDKGRDPMWQRSSVTSVPPSQYGPGSTTIQSSSQPIPGAQVQPAQFAQRPVLDDDDALIAAEAERVGRPVVRD